MPHLRFRAVTLDTLQQLSGPLLAELCELTGGKPEFVQGSVGAEREAIEAFFAEK